MLVGAGRMPRRLAATDIEETESGRYHLLSFLNRRFLLSGVSLRFFLSNVYESNESIDYLVVTKVSNMFQRQLFKWSIQYRDCFNTRVISILLFERKFS